MGISGFHLNLDKMDNWICEDDLDMFWQKNCLVLRPNINTCIDKLSDAKRAQKRKPLIEAIKKNKETVNKPNGQLEFDYDYDELGKLFLGECVEVDGHKFCPPQEPVVAYELEENDLSPDCVVMGDVVFCAHDIIEAMNGGRCMLAGLTFICEEDVHPILQNKCINFHYQSWNGVKPGSVCERELVNFLHG